MPIAILNQTERDAGVRIHYQLDGDASLPVLVLSHSLGVALDMWTPQISTLTPHFHLLRYDVRGHGGSSVPKGPYSVEDLGRDVVNLLGSLGIEQFSFCGLSMGGAIGQWIGLHVAGRLQKLVLANTAAKIGEEEIWNARIAQVNAEGLKPIIPGTLQRWFTSSFRETNSEVVSQTAATLEQMNVEGYVACCAAVRDADFRVSIHKLNVPTLVISGAEDSATPPVDGKYLADHIKGASFQELSAAHLSNVEAASDFNQHLLRFLLS
jgi:3-oxoadipate enol-lactonase